MFLCVRGTAFFCKSHVIWPGILNTVGSDVPNHASALKLASRRRRYECCGSMSCLLRTASAPANAAACTSQRSQALAQRRQTSPLRLRAARAPPLPPFIRSNILFNILNLLLQLRQRFGSGRRGGDVSHRVHERCPLCSLAEPGHALRTNPNNNSGGLQHTAARVKWLGRGRDQFAPVQRALITLRGIGDKAAKRTWTMNITGPPSRAALERQGPRRAVRRLEESRNVIFGFKYFVVWGATCR